MSPHPRWSTPWGSLHRRPRPRSRSVLRLASWSVSLRACPLTHRHSDRHVWRCVNGHARRDTDRHTDRDARRNTDRDRGRGRRWSDPDGVDRRGWGDIDHDLDGHDDGRPRWRRTRRRLIRCCQRRALAGLGSVRRRWRARCGRHARGARQALRRRRERRHASRRPRLGRWPRRRRVTTRTTSRRSSLTASVAGAPPYVVRYRDWWFMTVRGRSSDSSTSGQSSSHRITTPSHRACRSRRVSVRPRS